MYHNFKYSFHIPKNTKYRFLINWNDIEGIFLNTKSMKLLKFVNIFIYKVFMWFIYFYITLLLKKTWSLKHYVHSKGEF